MSLSPDPSDVSPPTVYSSRQLEKTDSGSRLKLDITGSSQNIRPKDIISFFPPSLADMGFSPSDALEVELTDPFDLYLGSGFEVSLVAAIRKSAGGEVTGGITLNHNGNRKVLPSQY